MKNSEAIKILRDTPIDIRSTREDDIHALYATAQGMAIEALSNTSNTLEALDCIDRQDAIDCEYQVKVINDIEYVMLSEVQMKMRKLPSAQCECIQKVNCLYCGHHVAERPFKVYCNIMCEWVDETGCCTLFEP